ncbi:tetratricopeptide repeat protein [Streptomyces sp. NPDC048269]|uniref:tetratricopeptide repeat protein n=1 Tax=Streptomyces sp. NPDC048269 TaxID=3155753 RepID=UPI003445F31A
MTGVRTGLGQRRWLVPATLAVAASGGMLGDLLFGIGLPTKWAVGGMVAAMGSVAVLTFTAERGSDAGRTGAAGDRPDVDQLEPVPVLIGRTTLARALCSMLEDVAPAGAALNTADPAHGRAQVVVVHGAAGTGKTTLALYAAHQVKGSYPDARLYIDLRGDGTAPVSSAQALEHFLRSLGVATAEIPRSVGDRASLFRSMAGRLRMLVLLDNAHSTEQIRPLIPSGPGCGVVITSRRALSVGNISHREEIRVSLPEEGEALAVLSHYAGRSRVLEDPAAALEIVHFCGRLPIALRIVGARLQSRADLTLRRMRARLEDERSRLRELAFEDSSLQACLLLSHRDLSDPAQRMLGALGGLPRGRLTEWHVGLVADDAAAATGALDELMETALMEASGNASNPEPEYRLHDLVRVFAHDQYGQLPPEERRLTERRAVLGYRDAALRLAAVRAPELAARESVTPAASAAGQPAAEWFATEAERLMWVHDRAARVGLPEVAPLIAECASYFLDDLGLASEALTAVFAAPQTGPRSAHARARAALRLADQDFTGALAALEDGGGPDSGPHEAARTLALTARIEREQGRYDVAAAHMSTAVEQLRALGDGWHLALALEMLGEIKRAQGMPSEGESCQREALAVAEGFADLRAQARLRRTLAETLAYKREFAEAGELLRASSAGFRRLGDRTWEARTLYVQGRVQRLLGQRTAALASYERALQMFDQLGERLWSGRVRNARIRLFAGLGDMDRAREEAQTALTVFAEVGHTLWHAHTLRDLGWLHLRSGHADEAVPALESAVRTCREAGDTHAEAAAGHLLGVAYRETGRAADARRELAAARAIYAAGGYAWQEATCAHDLVRALRAAGDAAGADELARTAEAANPYFVAMSGRDGAWAVPDED